MEEYKIAVARMVKFYKCYIKIVDKCAERQGFFFY